MTRHILNISDLTVDELQQVLSLSTDKKVIESKPLAGLGAALIFEKPSNRTRHSMEMAVVQLGGHPVYTRGEEVGFDERESVEDIAKIMSGYHAVLAARVFKHSVVARMAGASTVPVINMLSDLSHPLQALADVITMQEHAGPISSLKVAWVGDYNNVARSLGEAVCMLGGQFALGCPLGYDANDEEIERLGLLGGSISQSVNPQEAVAGAHVVHTDTWISMGQETETSARRKIFAGYCVDSSMLKIADKKVKFMHCMPAHRGEEVTAEVFDGPASLVIQQGHHRLTAARGALAWVMGK